MNAKKLKVLLITLIIMVFSGCGEKVYVDRIVEVPKVVPCKIEKPVCTFPQPTRTQVVEELYKCAQRYQEAIKICQ